jgi:hypothetical protein
MSKRWLVGLAAAIAVVSMAGAGFSAFTAQATVNGTASAATIGLEIQSNYTYSCYYFYNVPGAPGTMAFSGLNAAKTEVSLSVSNLVPGDYCVVSVTIQNVGSLPINVSVALSTAGFNGMCSAYQLDCYGVFTTSGIGSDGHIWWIGQPNYGVVTDSNANFVSLTPGGTYFDFIGIDLPAGSDDSSAATGTFSIAYTASEGI